MAVDFLRSGYEIMMKTAPDLAPVKVVWFRVPDSTPFRPGFSPFRSRNWDQRFGRDWRGDLGEQRPHDEACCQWIGPWYKGNPPAVYFGDHACGDDTAWAGQRIITDPVIVTGPDGFPDCCSRPCE